MCDSHVDVDRVLRETFVVRAEYHRTLTSTNDRAGQFADESPDRLPLLVVAEGQTAGRGRGANRWWTGRGSLAFSLLLEAGQLTTGRRRRSPLVALAAALAVVETVAPLLKPRPVGIHWPNDVLAAGGKLAGILVEVMPNRRHIVGIGVNTNNSLADAPPELRKTATTLWELSGVPHDQTTILVTVLTHLKDLFERLPAEPQEIASRADRLCLQHGKTLTLKQGSQSIAGRCVGIAPDGALRLDTPRGRRSLHSGTLCH